MRPNWGFSMSPAQGFSTRPGPALKHLNLSQGFSTRPSWALRHLNFSQGFSTRPNWSFSARPVQGFFMRSGRALRHLIFGGIWEQKLQLNFVTDQPSSVGQSPQKVTFFCVVGEMCPGVLGTKKLFTQLSFLRGMEWGGHWNMVCALLWVLYLWEIWLSGSTGTQKRSLWTKFGAIGPHCF